MAGNLKPAPIFLTEGTVAKLVGDRPAYGRDMVHIPLVSEPAKCGACGQYRIARCSYSRCPISDPGGESA